MSRSDFPETIQNIENDEDLFQSVVIDIPNLDDAGDIDIAYSTMDLLNDLYEEFGAS